MRLSLALALAATIVSPALAEDAAPQRLSDDVALQGNLDPLRLIAGGAALEEEVERIRADFDGVRHIFNLGHGIRPETPLEHVEKFVELVRRAR